MSGILGAWNSQKLIPWQKMLDDLTVLGRDAKGDWHDTEIGLSLGRTQFFNTPESCQEAPVIESEGCVLVWDGRIDDRESLLAGRSHVTDAQLIIEAYRRWGVDCLQHLTGEYVFILWDASNDLLLVGCDVVGGRTIAYYWDGQTLLLSSRVVTLLLHPQVSPKLDEIYLAHTIGSLWAHPPGITAFADIKRLQPGFALILKLGELQERKITQFSIPQGYESPKSPEVYYDRFWDLLNKSVKDRLRSYRPVCTSLSGGLDSTTITVSLLNHLPSVDAFSIMTETFPEFDERQPIESFLQRYPQTVSHEVNCDRAWSFTEDWDSLPVLDDHFTNSTLPMNIKLMQKIQAQGFGLVFDGEGGDELFYVGIQDLAKAGDWGQVFRYLKNSQSWYSPLWRGLAVPHLPKFLLLKWFARCQRKSNPLPPWIKTDYAQTSPMQTAIQQYFQSEVHDNTMQSISWAMTCSSSVALSQVYRLIGYCHNLEFTSPFLDQRLIEFALNLPPSLQYDVTHEKVFLRRANQKMLPEDLLWRSKSNHFTPLRDVAIAQGDQVTQLLRILKKSDLLQEFVDMQEFENSINNYRRNYSANSSKYMSLILYETLSFVNWNQILNNKYLNCRYASTFS